MSQATCKGCGAAIRWLKTPAGKSMPVDPGWLSEWVVSEPTAGAKRITLTTGDGSTETGWLASVITPGARQIEGYMAHWSTCPRAWQFRKRSPDVGTAKNEP